MRNKALGSKHSSKRQKLTYIVISVSMGLSFKCSGMVPQVNLSSFTKRCRSITLEFNPSALAFFIALIKVRRSC